LQATDSLRHDRSYQIEKRALGKAFDSLRRTIEILKRFNITLGEKHPSVGHGNFIISFIPTQRLNDSTSLQLNIFTLNIFIIYTGARVFAWHGYPHENTIKL